MAIKGDKRKVGLYLSGNPVLIKELNIAITPPTINNIVMFGEDDFLFSSQLIAHIDEFILEIKRGNSELDFFSDFQLLMTLIREDKMIKNMIINYFDFIFPDYKIQFNDNDIVFFIEIEEDKKQMVSRITPFSFDVLRDTIDNLFIIQPIEDEIEYNPANEAARKIAEQIKAGRKKTAQIKGEKNKDQSLFAQMASSLSIGLQMDLNIFFQYTPFQLYDLYRRFFLKQSYDLYQKVATTPLMDVSSMETPEEWTKYNY